MWDLGLYIAGTEAIVQRSCSKAAMECEDGWLDVPDVLAFYDYVGHNPAKGGLFRVLHSSRASQLYLWTSEVQCERTNLSDELSPGMPWNAWAYR